MHFPLVFVPGLNRGYRRERMKDMQANEHGRYTEITNEKEVIRASVREYFPVMFDNLKLIFVVSGRNRGV